MDEPPEKNGEDLWKKVVVFCRGMMETDADRSKMERYFPQFVSHRFVDGEYHIGVPGETEVDWFAPLYSDIISKALEATGVPDTKVKFVVDSSAAPLRPAPKMYNTEKQAAPAASRAPLFSSTLPLDPLYTFENFVRGPSNSFAYAIATAVAKNPDTNNYNPLFIYGGTGLGKTHLMESIGNYINKKNPKKSVCYITSETFLNKYVEALANDSINEFRARYRNIDVLLIDDVQFIAGKEKIQEEFFHTFTQLMTCNKRVVLTSDVPPKDLSGLESRLISRFQQGTVVQVEAPSYETRLAIIKVKVKAASLMVPEDVQRWIAENIRSHVRALEGALSIAEAFLESNPDIPLTPEALKHLMKDLIEEERALRNLSVNEIISRTAEFYGVTVKDILSPERTQPLVTARQMAMFLSVKLTTCSLPAIGKAFDKNHSTVHHGAGNIQKRIDVEPELMNALEEITTRLGRKMSDVLA
jgi:chromosomal replication initiator protein